MAAQICVAQAIVWYISRKELNLYLYKLEMSTTLTEDHKASRLHFALHCWRKLRNDARFLERRIFSDDCKFTLCGNVNKNNCRIWGSERPNEVAWDIRKLMSIMICCAVSKNEIVGLYFFENENITGRTCKRMVRYFLLPKLECYSEELIRQQDCAPPHYSIESWNYLDQELFNQWMGRGGPISWHSRSPDLTPCDYFL